MKILSILALLFGFTAYAELPHLDLDMTGPEYRALIEKRGLRLLQTDPLQPIMNMGKRNIDWLEHINSLRPEGAKLEMSNASTQVGIPIDAPRESNRAIIAQKIAELKAEMPDEMEQILFNNVPFPNTPPITDEQYIDLTRKADKVYQQASRWLLQEPALFQYAARAVTDIRGYFFLQREPDREAKLKGFNQLDSETKAKIQGWLLGQCRNTGASIDTCKRQFQTSLSGTGNALAFFNQHLNAAKRKFDSFFAIQFPRTEVQWTTANPNLFKMPFLKPARLEVENWLRDNIEDEWQLGLWHLRLDFRAAGRDLAHVVFEAGATPHVNGLGGSEITMDANRPLNEYTTTWTIRHEFGHVLGFPDCYVEYFDNDRQVMINYQIDIDNIMCARTGHLRQRHFDELKANYLH